MKVSVLVLLVVAVVALLAVAATIRFDADTAARLSCEAKGGVMPSTQRPYVCLAKGAVIP